MLCPLSSLAQKESAVRNGYIKGYYDKDSTHLKYEGEFVHGKEKGLFKFYQRGHKNPVATKFFQPGSDTVVVTFLTQKGKIVSEGKMLGTERTGTWKYYHDDSDKLMMLENYKNGVLEGEKLVYYDNGTLAERSNYQKGLLHGQRFLYSVKGVVLEDLQYEDGELHGPAKFYNGKGELLSEGNYKRDKHFGIWRYYENGELKEEKSFF
ncbi:hypothetical protein GCM10010465_20790 [Actinomadura fibrosa]